MNIVRTLLSAGFLICFSIASATHAENNIIGEVELQTFRSSNPYDSARLYIEKPLNEAWSIFGTAYTDSEFDSLYVGIARTFGDVQVGISAGPARYEGQVRRTWNPWIWGSSGLYEYLLDYEYTEDDRNPGYTRGYVHRRFGNWIAGLNGESYTGTGPMFGKYFFEDRVKAWVSIPVFDTQEEDAVQVVLGITITF